MTVFALVSFRDFKRMEKGDGEATDPSFYQLPQGFSETTVQAMFGFQGQGKRAKKQPGLGDSAADLVPGGDEIGVRDIEASGEDPWLAEWQDEQDF